MLDLQPDGCSLVFVIQDRNSLSTDVYISSASQCIKVLSNWSTQWHSHIPCRNLGGGRHQGAHRNGREQRCRSLCRPCLLFRIICKRMNEHTCPIQSNAEQSNSNFPAKRKCGTIYLYRCSFPISMQLLRNHCNVFFFLKKTLQGLSLLFVKSIPTIRFDDSSPA